MADYSNLVSVGHILLVGPETCHEAAGGSRADWSRSAHVALTHQKTARWKLRVKGHSPPLLHLLFTHTHKNIGVEIKEVIHFHGNSTAWIFSRGSNLLFFLQRKSLSAMNDGISVRI